MKLKKFKGWVKRIISKNIEIRKKIIATYIFILGVNSSAPIYIAVIIAGANQINDENSKYIIIWHILLNYKN